MILCERCGIRRAKFVLTDGRSCCLRCRFPQDAIERILIIDNDDTFHADEDPEPPRFNPERPDPPTPEEW